jgi:small subunit ribosomal protein S4
MFEWRGPRLRIIRRLGELPAFTKKVRKNTNRPGEHGKTRIKNTQFGYRLIEKQKVRFYYGITEEKLVHYVKKARRVKSPTNQVLLQHLEMRLDNTIYLTGWARTLPAARQIVNHGHILVDKNKVTTPSFTCLPNQKITKKNPKGDSYSVPRNLPSYVSLSAENSVAVVGRRTSRDSVNWNLNDFLVIEYYSNRL